MRAHELRHPPVQPITYTPPDAAREWSEARRYPEFRQQGRLAWLQTVSQGHAVAWSDLHSVGNVETHLHVLAPDKVTRAQRQVTQGRVEMPIVGQWPDHSLDLIGGNTRTAALLAAGHDPQVWLVTVPARLSHRSSR
jgi:hypothetical protein